MSSDSKKHKIITKTPDLLVKPCVTIMCHNDEFSYTMIWVNCLLKDSEFFILFAENSQSFSKFPLFPFS